MPSHKNRLKDVMPYGSQSRKEYDAQRKRDDLGPDERKRRAVAAEKKRKELADAKKTEKRLRKKNKYDL